MHRIRELVRLHRKGVGCRKVAALLKMGPATERRYRHALERAELLVGDADDLPEEAGLREALERELPPQSAPQQTSTIEEWRSKIADMAERGAGPKAIFDCLRQDEPEFEGSHDAVKRMCRGLARAKGVSAEDVVIPVVTAPGQSAQIDFGYVGKLYDPAQERFRKAWVFIMVLGHSRHMFARVVFDQKTRTWLHLHVEAFNFFGGVPEELVPDNLKAAVVRCAFGVDDETMLNRSYRELAQHYDCMIDPTPPRSPEKKGKVESAVKYVKRNYFKPRDLTQLDIDAANEGLTQWVIEIAGTRPHGTTGRKPLELFGEEEQQVLKPLPPLPFEIAEWKQAKVHADSHIAFERRCYSVPWEHIGKQVQLKATPSSVVIYTNEGERISTHERKYEPGFSTNDAHLPEHRRDYRHRSRSYWEARAEAIGPEVLTFVQEVFEADEVKSNLRTVQAIVTHLRQFPSERARAACGRASHFGNYTYKAIKDILRKGLDMAPLPDSLFPDEGECRVEPRYARGSDYFETMTKEMTS